MATQEVNLPQYDYAAIFEQLINDPTKKWNASQIAAGTLTSLQQVNGTPTTTFNLNTGQIILNDGTTNRMLIGYSLNGF